MARDVEFYINHGFDRPMAEYMSSGRRRAVSARPLGGFSIAVTFDDGREVAYDLSGVAEPGTALGCLRDPEILARVFVDENGSVAWDIDPEINSSEVWSNRIDLSADEIYVYGTGLT